MKLALSNLAWNPADEGAAVKLMQKYEFEGVEIAWRKQPYENIFPIVAIQSLFYSEPTLQIFGDSVMQDRCFGHLLNIARSTLNERAHKLIFGAPKSRRDGEFFVGVNFFRRCANSGIPICIEPNPPQYGCNFITNTKEAQELIAAVNHPNFRLHLDSGIMTLNGETDIPADIAHFHVSQPYLAPVGPGTVDHVAMAAALRAINYQGWCSVEMLPCDNLEKSLEFVSGIYGD